MRKVEKIRLKKWVKDVLMLIFALALISVVCVFLENIWWTIVFKVVSFIILMFIGDILMKYTDLGDE